MLIEDKELRDLYEAASAEHIDNLEAGILNLENDPTDLSIMKDLLREAHSLKGDSRMLGVEDAETLTHELESRLQGIEQGQPLTPELCQRLYQGVDAIRQIARSAVTGEPITVDTFAVMALLRGGEANAADVAVAEPAVLGQVVLEPVAFDSVVLDSAVLDSAVPESAVAEQVMAEQVMAEQAGLQSAALEEAAVEAASLSEAADNLQTDSEDVAAFAAAVALLRQAEEADSAASLVEPFTSEDAAAEFNLAELNGTEVRATEATATATLPMQGMPAEVVAAMQQDWVPPTASPDDELTEADLETIPFSEGPVSYFIEDDELRSLYEVASTEHLDNLQTGLLQLEQQPDDRSQMKDLLREAHSLKGDSRMLGVKDAESLTHELETLLQEVNQGQRRIDAALCDRLYQALDAIRQIAHSAVTGDACTVNVFQVMTLLLGADIPASQAETELLVADATAVSAESVPAAPVAADPVAKSAMDEFAAAIAATQREMQSVASPTGDPTVEPPFVSSAATKIQKAKAPTPPESPTAKPNSPQPVSTTAETIRVESSKLDSLITQVSELAVAQRRIGDWGGSVTELLDFWEAWAREAFVNQLNFSKTQEQLPSDVAESLQEFYGRNQKRIEQLGDYVQQFRRQTSEDGARLSVVAGNVEAGVRNLRMLPLSKVFGMFRRMVRDLSMQQGKTIEFIIEGGDTQVDKRIIEEIKDPLSHLLRNAVDHGIETMAERMAAGKSPTATLTLRGYRSGSSVIVDLVDDGRGLNLEKIKQTALSRGVCDEAALEKMDLQQVQTLIFQPGFSTRDEVSEISGRGVGLDVVRTNIERLKGSISVNSNWGQGCQFRLTMNPTLATTEAIILTLHQASYAIPIESVDRMLMLNREDLFTIKGNLTATIGGEPISVTWLSELLELPTSLPTVAQEASQISSTLSCIVLNVGSKKLGLFVDNLTEQQEIVLKAPSKILQRVRNISGSTILGNGEICLVLNPQDLIKTALKQKGISDVLDQIDAVEKHQPRILLVEDSIPIRTQVKRILEGAGYEVTATVDGLDGYNTLRAQEQPFAAIVSDVEMPNLTGLELAAKVREHPEYDALPFVLVTTLATEADRQRGRDAGANAYLSKGDFDQNLLLDTLRGLIQS